MQVNAKLRQWAAITVLLLALCGGCEANKPAKPEGKLTTYRARMIAPERQDYDASSGRTRPEPTRLVAQDAQEIPEPQPVEPTRVLLTDPLSMPAADPAEILSQIPDPVEAETVLNARLERIRATAREDRVVTQYATVVEKALEYLRETRRDRRIELSLHDCIRMALEHNYSIRIDSYTPAIGRAELVEAEAAFDSVFFLDYTYNNVDQPTASELASNQTDVRSYSGGIRKLLPTGTQVQVSLDHSRTFTDLQFATLNPAYDVNFTASLTQPILRGFGLDYNRAGISIARANLGVDYEIFEQSVRDQLLDVEQTYWSLVEARRGLMILAEAVAQNWVTYQNMEQRRIHDATPVEVANSRSAWRQREVDFQEAQRIVRDTEDRLRNLINAPDTPDLLLSADAEIIPTDVPTLAPFAIDQMSAARSAVEQRSEIRQARFALEQARVQTMRAKNETLPQLDLSFNYRVQGLGTNPDNAFDNMTTNRFRSYSLTLNFSYPIGNRGPRASLRGARMQEQQAVIGLQRTMDGVVEEVNVAVRRLIVRYRQIPPQLDAVISAGDNLRALQERTDQVTPSFLQTELNAVEQLANTRSTLLRVVREYNVFIAQFERAKGTLLDYNKVSINDGITTR